MFNINDFKTKGLTHGGARPTLFQVELAHAPFRDQSALQKLMFTCRAASLPGAAVGTIEAPYFGRRAKFAGDRQFNDWSITVMNDEDFKVRALFEAWNNSLNSLVSNVRSRANGGSENSYKGIMTVTQFDKEGGPIRKYEMVGCFPVVLGDIALDWDSQNQIETFQVQIAYDYWLPIGETAGATKYLNDTGDGTTGFSVRATLNI